MPCLVARSVLILALAPALMLAGLAADLTGLLLRTLRRGGEI